MKKAFLRIKERLPSHQGNAPFVCNQYYSLPLSIRRGGGGEATSFLVGETGWGLSIRRGVGGEATSSLLGRGGGGFNISLLYHS